MGCVVAFIDQYSYGIFDSAADAPEGSAVFDSPESLCVLPLSTLNEIRVGILKTGTFVSSKESAARMLWFVLMTDPEVAKKPPYEAQQDAFGNRKFALRPEAVFIRFPYGAVPAIDSFVDKLWPQFRTAYQLLVDDGRRVWLHSEAEDIIDASDMRQRWPGLVSTNAIEKMLRHRVLSRISIAQIAQNPLLADCCLLSKFL